MPADLSRFEEAQRGVYQQALRELRAGRKESHWMWFIFPQIAGLGRSPTAQFYAISSLDEARAYLEHPILGPRLRECCDALCGQSASAQAIFGGIDALKLKSSLTLFELVGAAGDPFGTCLDQFFDGERDEMTLRLLGPS